MNVNKLTQLDSIPGPASITYRQHSQHVVVHLNVFHNNIITLRLATVTVLRLE